MKRRLPEAGQMICVLAILGLFADAAAAQQGSRSHEDGARGDKARDGGALDDGAPKVGAAAPLFKLKTLDGDKEVDLAKVIKSKPVVLIFGSYT